VNQAYKCRPLYVEYLDMIQHKNGILHNHPREIVRHTLDTQQRNFQRMHHVRLTERYARVLLNPFPFCFCCLIAVAGRVGGQEHPDPTRLKSLLCHPLCLFLYCSLPIPRARMLRSSAAAGGYCRVAFSCPAPARRHPPPTIHPLCCVGVRAA
jgi:hypothetical protein